MHFRFCCQLCVGFIAFALNAQSQVVTDYSLTQIGAPPLIASNSTGLFILRGDTLWASTGRGVSFTSDGGRSWINLRSTSAIDDQPIATFCIRGDEIWASSSYSKLIDNSLYPIGTGLHYSLDRGRTWNYVAQPVDTGKVDTIIYGHNKIPSLAIPVTEANATFGIGLTSNTVWIASFYGMLRRSTDHGKTWLRVVLPPDFLNSIAPTDTLSFNMSNSQGRLNLGSNRNHIVVAVLVSSDSLIWIGTAGGINKSTDGGTSWRKFNHSNQQHAISGDYVVAIREHSYQRGHYIWAACNTGQDPEERRGICYTSDRGETWNTIPLTDFARDIAFKDSIVYIATDGGIYRTADMGNSFLRAGTIYDPTNGQRLTDIRVFGVQAKGDTVWIAGPDGTAYTIDSQSESFGTSWHICRTYEPVTNSAKTYSYPLPFSPLQEIVRLHYSTAGQTATVTIRVFDFAMQPVKTLIQSATRSGTVEHDEIWDGRDDRGRRVANGVYFYRVEVNGADPIWGKIFVLQ